MSQGSFQVLFYLIDVSPLTSRWRSLCLCTLYADSLFLSAWESWELQTVLLSHARCALLSISHVRYHVSAWHRHHKRTALISQLNYIGSRIRSVKNDRIYNLQNNNLKGYLYKDYCAIHFILFEVHKRMCIGMHKYIRIQLIRTLVVRNLF